MQIICPSYIDINEFEGSLGLQKYIPESDIISLPEKKSLFTNESFHSRNTEQSAIVWGVPTCDEIWWWIKPEAVECGLLSKMDKDGWEINPPKYLS